MRTRIAELFGIEHPSSGRHAPRRPGRIAAAGSEAGSFGTLTALTQPSVAALAPEIVRCRAMTAKPFAINLTFLPSVNPPDYPGLWPRSSLAVCESSKPPGTTRRRDSLR